VKLTGSNYQCIGCGRHFAGPAAYGNHFDSETAECLSPDAMRAAGFVLSAADFWTIQTNPLTESAV
jgi:hypothetical protein